LLPVAAPRRIPITLDVTDSESCAAAAREVVTHTDGLGAVINFAGVLDLGSLMEVSEERLWRILDVNVVGTHRVIVAFTVRTTAWQEKRARDPNILARRL
jgi:NAD(P)-dependent dehydrogenase (short-subunit alcohol dehydrogenase family)